MATEANVPRLRCPVAKTVRIKDRPTLPGLDLSHVPGMRWLLDTSEPHYGQETLKELEKVAFTRDANCPRLEQACFSERDDDFPSVQGWPLWVRELAWEAGRRLTHDTHDLFGTEMRFTSCLVTRIIPGGDDGAGPVSVPLEVPDGHDPSQHVMHLIVFDTAVGDASHLPPGVLRLTSSEALGQPCLEWAVAQGSALVWCGPKSYRAYRATIEWNEREAPGYVLTYVALKFQPRWR